MDDAGLLRITIGSMFGTWRTITSEGDARALERSGLLAAFVPATPERSVFNSVIYDDPDAIKQARDELAGLYERAGIRAWTVWVPEADTRVAEMLERAGHVLDAEPRAMGMELDEFEQPDMSAVDWRPGTELMKLA